MDKLVELIYSEFEGLNRTVNILIGIIVLILMAATAFGNVLCLQLGQVDPVRGAQSFKGPLTTG